MASAPPDAGEEPPPPVDAGESTQATSAPDGGKADPRKKRDAGTRTTGAGTVGGIEGPRGMVIQTGGDTDPDLELAKTCKAGWSPTGEAKLSLKGCAKDCAVIIEGTCAGRTPVDEAPAPVGNKSLVVVCGGKKTNDKVAKLRAGETFGASCR